MLTPNETKIKDYGEKVARYEVVNFLNIAAVCAGFPILHYTGGTMELTYGDARYTVTRHPEEKGSDGPA